MVRLKQSSKVYKGYPYSVYLGMVLMASASLAEVIPIFDPLLERDSHTSFYSTQGFIANDMLSIKDFLHNWAGDYHPKNKENTAIKNYRIDIGLTLSNNWYLGYFSTQELYTVANKGFVDFYYHIKNDSMQNKNLDYDLYLNMQGYATHGLMLSKSFLLFDNSTHQIRLGNSLYLSYATDVQDGYLKGTGSINEDQTYSASVSAEYRYIDNLLYDYSPKKTYGIGYGSHVGIAYSNKPYMYTVHFIANDLLAQISWRNLPYSSIKLETKNQTTNHHGYIEYNPTISGIETYTDYLQDVMPKYHIDIEKQLLQSLSLTVGIEQIQDLTIPYFSVSKLFDDKQEIALTYENRFHSIGIHIKKESYRFSLSSNGLLNASAFSFSGRYRHTF